MKQTSPLTTMLSRLLPRLRGGAAPTCPARSPSAGSGTPASGSDAPSPRTHAPSPRGEHGSALIISLMIMVILTMMGVTFLVLSEQENKISVNSRDHAQALYLAEAAVNIGLTWFNDPSAGNPFKPDDNQMNLLLRKGRIFADTWDNDDERAAGPTDTVPEVDGSAGSVYTGGTQGGGGASKFNKPYRGSYENGLWGRRDTPDVLICNSATLDIDADGTADCTDDARDYMDELNNALLMATSLRTDGHRSESFGSTEIEQIRVYRPPIDFTLHTRYGIATIEATAIKRVRGQIVARRTVREVIQEIPFPGPGGAIETDGTIEFSGSSGVHWGAVVSASTGDDIDLGNTANNFVDCAVARQTAARFGFDRTINPAARRIATGAPVGGVTPYLTWLSDAVGVTRNGVRITANWSPPSVPDPWMVFKARRNVLITGETVPNTPHPYEYDPTAQVGDAGGAISGNGGNYEFDHLRQANWSHIFQKQIIRFPPIDYDTWKAIAQTGQQGMYYFKWVAGSTYKQDGIGTTRDWNWWLTNYKTGVFFFDTTNSKKPVADGSNLTPSHGWTPGMYVEGFFYVNSLAFNSTGAGGGPDKELNMPGEPFLDDGIDLHAPGDTVGNNCICLRYDAEDGCVLGARPIGFSGGQGPDCRALNFADGDDCTCPAVVLSAMDDAASFRESQTFRNGVWDSDIDNDGFTDTALGVENTPDWNRFIGDNGGGGNGGYTLGHGYLPGVLPGYPANRSHQQGNNDNDWKRDPRFLNNIVDLDGVNADRQPHEPFVNFDSLTDGDVVETWAGGDHGLKTDYTAAGEVTEKDAGGTAVDWTTRARDADGALYGLQPHVNGVMFFEGEYTGSGNINVYGSMLMKGGYGSTGSLEVWFNEDLVKGDFPPADWKLPRVFSTARDTE